MPISPVTNAVPNSSPASNPQILYGPDSPGITSPAFSVSTQPVYIQAFNLISGQAVRIEMLSGTHAALFKPMGKTLLLTPNQTMLRLDWPGRYRTVVQGNVNFTAVVTMYQGTMSDDTTYGVSAANGGATDFVSLIGDVPITVDGSGSVPDPYHVGIQDLNYLNGGINLGPAAGDNLVGMVNVVIGLNTGDSAVISNSILIGQTAGASSSNADQDIAIGFDAGHGMDGQDNIILGTTSGQFVTGDRNVIIGNNAGTGPSEGDGITGSDNILVGTEAGIGGEITSVIAIGNTAGQFSPATNAVMIGTNAGTAAQTDGGIFIGLNAGKSSAATNNTIGIGVNAGNTSTQRGIFIGGEAGHFNTLEDVIIIDESASGIVATADHYCMLGSASITHTATAGSVISGGAISASDIRLKFDVENLQCGADKVRSLRPVSFRWDAVKLMEEQIPHLDKDIGGVHAGLIAQEVAQVLPEVINRVAGKSGEEYNFIHYDRLIPYMIAYIQSLENRIEQLENK